MNVLLIDPVEILVSAVPFTFPVPSKGLNGFSTKIYGAKELMIIVAFFAIDSSYRRRRFYW